MRRRDSIKAFCGLGGGNLDRSPRQQCCKPRSMFNAIEGENHFGVGSAGAIDLLPSPSVQCINVPCRNATDRTGILGL